jgi:hypothetical protein
MARLRNGKCTRAHPYFDLARIALDTLLESMGTIGSSENTYSAYK